MRSLVLTAQEMVRLETMAIADGYSQEALMLEAGSRVAEVASLWADKRKSILLLIGKGNKGGDAFVAGKILLQKGLATANKNIQIS